MEEKGMNESLKFDF